MRWGRYTRTLYSDAEEHQDLLIIPFLKLIVWLQHWKYKQIMLSCVTVFSNTFTDDFRKKSECKVFPYSFMHGFHTNIKLFEKVVFFHLTLSVSSTVPWFMENITPDILYSISPTDSRAWNVIQCFSQCILIFSFFLCRKLYLFVVSRQFFFITWSIGGWQQRD